MGNPKIVFQAVDVTNSEKSSRSDVQQRLINNRQEDEQNRDDVVTQMSKFSVNTELESMDRSTSHKCQNPLHWFGVLVPQSLRWCQHNFIHATELILSVSTAKARLTHALYHLRLSVRRKLSCTVMLVNCFWASLC